ncbi:hypothetical protein [Tenacibaculum xiamenense]|uniref:hypothetical protein n=1 Tax=Tenacibaculum xiamenense TaxID=1261553 RepID=UPI0038B69ED6
MTKKNYIEIRKKSSLFDFILDEVPENGMIKDDSKEIYHDRSVELLKNALYNE